MVPAYSTLIVCIGNSLVADDGVGCRIHDRLKDTRLPGTRLVLVGVGGLTLIDYLAGEKGLIVVDAVQFGSLPGTVHVIPFDKLPKNRNTPVSLHGIGIVEALDLCRVLYPERMPEETFLVGIEGKRFDAFDTRLSPEILLALPEAIKAVTHLVNRQAITAR